jgi:hypothetical protein
VFGSAPYALEPWLRARAEPMYAPTANLDIIISLRFGFPWWNARWIMTACR